MTAVRSPLKQSRCYSPTASRPYVSIVHDLAESSRVWTNEDELLGRSKLRLLALVADVTAIHHHPANLVTRVLAEVLVKEAQVIGLKIARMRGVVPLRTEHHHVVRGVEVQARIVKPNQIPALESAA